MAKRNPITGPFPDGDTRNITLAPSGNSIEPDRTGPLEVDHRNEGAPTSVTGDLPTHKDETSTRTPSASMEAPRRTKQQEGETQDAEKADPTAPKAPEMGFGGVGGALAEDIEDEQNPAKRARGDAVRPLGNG